MAHAALVDLEAGAATHAVIDGRRQHDFSLVNLAERLAGRARTIGAGGAGAIEQTLSPAEEALANQAVDLLGPEAERVFATMARTAKTTPAASGAMPVS